MEGLPLREKGIITIDKKRVIKLLAQLGFQGSETGEIDDKATGIQLFCRKPDRETAAIAMHEAAMSFVTPLPMTAGISAEGFAAAVRGRRNEQGGETRNGARCGKIQALPECPRPDAAPQPRLH